MTLLEQLREQVRSLLTDRAARQADIDSVISAVEAHGDGNLSDDETTRLNEARAAVAEVDGQLAEAHGQIDGMEADTTRRQAATDMAERFGGTTETPEARVTSEPDIYRRGGDASFFRDLLNQGTNPGANERLLRHQAHASGPEARAVESSELAGLVPPAYLLDEFAPIARAGRPLLEIVRGEDLPPQGMVLNVPHGTTGTVVASQTGQNQSVTSQDYAATDLPVPVRTVSGRQEVSRQSLDRGYNVDSIIMADLAGAYSAELDRQAIAGTGTGESHSGSCRPPTWRRSRQRRPLPAGSCRRSPTRSSG